MRKQKYSSFLPKDFVNNISLKSQIEEQQSPPYIKDQAAAGWIITDTLYIFRKHKTSQFLKQ